MILEAVQLKGLTKMADVNERTNFVLIMQLVYTCLGFVSSRENYFSRTRMIEKSKIVILEYSIILV